MMRHRFRETTKNFSKIIRTAVVKVEEVLNEISTNIKDTVNKESKILQNQQLKFPWTGCENEELIKEECLNLSKDRKTLLRCPPPLINFVFDYEKNYPLAMAIMEIDTDLVETRYELVPKYIKEQDFWRNYFYHIELICRSYEHDFNKFDIKVHEEYEIIDPTEAIVIIDEFPDFTNSYDQ